jgi:hypothetical protein
MGVTKVREEEEEERASRSHSWSVASPTPVVMVETPPTLTLIYRNLNFCVAISHTYHDAL